MLPLLQLASDGKEHTMQEARTQLAAKFGMTEEEQNALLPTSGQPVFANRVGWARTYLTKAGALDAPRRGTFRISERGREILFREKPQQITVKFLRQFPEFVEFTKPQTRHEEVEVADSIAEDKQTPEEMLDVAYQTLRRDTAVEVLLRVKKSSAAFFERLVVELLLKMGYGGSLKEAGNAIGRSGDEGIDGIIKEDRLGLDLIYLQAKKWEGTVGRPEIQKFVGALHGKRAKKGVFITTGTFSSEATEYVGNIDPKVVLIDGRQLAEFMIDFGLGVTESSTYQVKRIDSDYFGEE
ncbi:MAG TPA: restriction endonuclease [Candidatus Acidoferrum sp.]|jgi:restriction system protein